MIAYSCVVRTLLDPPSKKKIQGSTISMKQARRQRGAGGQCPPDFRFCPPNFFLAPHGIFLGGRSWVFLGGKNVKIYDFDQKKRSAFGEDLFFFEITCFWSENL